MWTKIEKLRTCIILVFRQYWTTVVTTKTNLWSTPCSATMEQATTDWWWYTTHHRWKNLTDETLGWRIADCKKKRNYFKNCHNVVSGFEKRFMYLQNIFLLFQNLIPVRILLIKEGWLLSFSAKQKRTIKVVKMLQRMYHTDFLPICWWCFSGNAVSLRRRGELMSSLGVLSTCAAIPQLLFERLWSNGLRNWDDSLSEKKEKWWREL